MILSRRDNHMAKPVSKKKMIQKKREKKPVKLAKPKTTLVKTKKKDVKTVVKTKAQKSQKKLKKVERTLQQKKPVKKEIKKETIS
jgi:hypothetical protein